MSSRMVSYAFSRRRDGMDRVHRLHVLLQQEAKGREHVAVVVDDEDLAVGGGSLGGVGGHKGVFKCSGVGGGDRGIVEAEA
jgi:hypothetical protein